MFKTLIWATDGSAGAEVALVEARRLAELSGGRIVAVHVDQRLTGRFGGWSTLADEEDRSLALHTKVGELKAEGVDIEYVVRHGRQFPADIVAAFATEMDADLILCGTRGHGSIAGALLGSFTQHLLHVSPCPVLVVPERAALDRAAYPTRDEVTA